MAVARAVEALKKRKVERIIFRDQQLKLAKGSDFFLVI